MVDPIFTYIAGIAFLVLLIAPVLYLLYAEADTEAGDEYPSESVVGGVGPVAKAGGDTEADTAVEAESAEAAEEGGDEAAGDETDDTETEDGGAESDES
jgi:hypothetical protein